MAALVYGDRATQTERVMNALFPEDALRLFHRVSCEMAYADRCLVKLSRSRLCSRKWCC